VTGSGVRALPCPWLLQLALTRTVGRNEKKGCAESGAFALK